MIIAIDPGANGGIAVWHEDVNRLVRCFPMPDTEGDIVDAFDFVFSEFHPCPAKAYIEKVGGYCGGKGNTGSSMFPFGQNYGFLRCSIMTRHIPLIEVTPQRWQKALGLGTRDRDIDPAAAKREWKNKLKAEAQRRFPGETVTLKTADALLILEAAKMGAIG